MKLPANHVIRNLPDDFKLYCLVFNEMVETGIDVRDMRDWAYEKAREENIPSECVFKVLRLVFIHESDKDKMFKRH